MTARPGGGQAAPSLAQSEVDLVGRRLAQGGLWSLAASISVAAVATALERYPSVVTSVEVLAVLAGVLFWASVPQRGAARGRLVRNRATVAVAVSLLISLAWPTVSGGGSFPGNGFQWMSAHVIALGAVLAHRHLTWLDVRRVLRALMLVSLACALMGPAAFSVDERVLLPLPGRLTGALGHPNATGPAAAILLVVCRGSGSRWRTLDTVLGVVVLLCTLSYTALIAVLAAVVTLLLRRRLLQVVAFLVTSLATLAPFAVARLAPDLISPGLFTGRGAIWRWAMELPHPFVGLGTGLFNARRTSATAIPWFHAHDGFLMGWLSGGWVLAIAGFVLLTGLGLGALATRDQRVLACWTVVAVTSLTEVPLFLDFPGARPFILSLLAVMCLAPPSRRADGEDAHAHRAVIA